MKKIVFVILLVIVASCNQKAEFDYKYANQEQVINCNDATNKLLNEALYSFENDLVNQYDSINKAKTASYGRFMYRGMNGTAAYEDIASDDTQKIIEALIAANILVKNKKPSHLNYQHPAVNCIIENIKDDGIKTTIQALIEVNSMDPKLFDSRLRNFGRSADRDRYLALYISLDGYYQQVLKKNLSESPQP